MDFTALFTELLRINDGDALQEALRLLKVKETPLSTGEVSALEIISRRFKGTKQGRTADKLLRVHCPHVYVAHWD